MDLSIIIPAYNSIDTIGITLDSIAKQEVSINYEVIIVNDCSDYNYFKFIKKYKKKMNIKEIMTPKNIGPGGARQFGIENSSSKYIIFIDSDDYFCDNKSIIKMYNEIETNNKDLVICNFIYERDNKRLIKEKDLTWLHGKIYRRQFLIDNEIKFNNSRANEDNGFNRLFLLLRPKVTFLDEIVYVYKENPNSLTRKNNRLYRFEGIEGFCYNMNWAMNQSLKRGVNKYLIGRLSLDVLTTLYYYYFDLKDEYDVNKIIIWAEDIYIKFRNERHQLDEKTINQLLENKKKLLTNYINVKENEYYFDFNKFLEMIEVKCNEEIL